MYRLSKTMQVDPTKHQYDSQRCCLVNIHDYARYVHGGHHMQCMDNDLERPNMTMSSAHAWILTICIAETDLLKLLGTSPDHIHVENLH